MLKMEDLKEKMDFNSYLKFDKHDCSVLQWKGISHSFIIAKGHAIVLRSIGEK